MISVMDRNAITFTAQATEVKSRVTTSNDREFSVKLITDDPTLLSLGVLDAQKTIEVSITVTS